MEEGFPLLTTKKIHFKSVVAELIFFLKGLTNVQWLNEKGCTIWDEWASEDGSLGPIYGAQWRNFNNQEYDQILEVERLLKEDPTSRRMVVSAWNPLQIREMALPPCHLLFQLRVLGKFLNLVMFQRSADAFLGVPYNIASYALLLEMFSQVHGFIPGTLHISFGDFHIYENHQTQVKRQLSRPPRSLPKVEIKEGRKSITEFEVEDVSLLNYNPYPAISAPIAI